MTVDDVPRAAELTMQFAERAHHPAGGNPEAVKAFLSKIVGTQDLIAFKLVHNDVITGVIFGVFGGDWLSGSKIAQELVWYTVPGERAGLILMHHFVEEARIRGARWVLSGYVPGFHEDRVSRVLMGLGFREIEKWWMKEIE